MWVIAIVWVIAPSGAYVAVWMTGIFLVASIVAGAKLHVVTMRLASMAYANYRDELTPAQKLKKPKASSALGPALSRMSKRMRRGSANSPEKPSRCRAPHPGVSILGFQS